MKRLSRLLLAMLGLLLVIAPAASAQEAENSAVVVVHRVDSTSSNVEAVVLSDNYSVTKADIALVEEGSEVAVTSARRASASGRNVEIVFVIDTSERLAKGEVLAKVRTAVADEIRKLPAGTRVAVVAAGATTTVKAGMTTDLDSAAAAVEDLALSEGSGIYNAIDRAGSLLDTEDDWISTVVVFSGGEDLSSTIGSDAARVSLIQDGAQLVTVRYAGGEAGLTDIVDRTGGIELGAADPTAVAAAMSQATRIAGDRLLVTYPGQTSPSVRGDASISIGGTTTDFSYPGGTFTERPIGLQPVAVAEESGIAFFRSQMGLYVALALAFVGIGLAVYALGALFASGETSLQGLLDRYSGEGDGADLNDEEQALVQTALVKRAVEFSETFAEDRGFLGKIEELLERAKLPLRPGEAMSFYVVGIVIAAFLGFILIGGPVGMLILAFVAAVGMLFAVRFKARRRIRAFEQQLPDALQLLAGTLRAGYSLPQGLEAVSHEIVDPMGYELRRVMTEARLGREIEDALGATAERLSSPDFAWAVMAIGIQREVGGNLNELLMTVADTMIARERLKGEVAALTAEGRISAIILGGLPPGLGFVMWIMNPEYINTLFTETLGHILIGLGFVSAVIGMAWMKKVITINV